MAHAPLLASDKTLLNDSAYELGSSNEDEEGKSYGDGGRNKLYGASVVDIQRKTSVAVVVVASVFGNLLEWYDFSVYSAFAVEIGENFFPSEVPEAGAGGGGGGDQCGEDGSGGGSLLATFAVFGAAFIARPIGGILMGHIGDKMGRTLALQLSVILQGVAAVALAVLPSNQCPGCGYQIGISASILLVVVRLLQGFSVGGELVGSLIYSYETAPKKQKALLSVVPLVACNAGIASGYLIAGILHLAMSENQIRIWGWRLAFALGSPLALLALFMRRWLQESDDFTQEKEKMKTTAPPLVQVVQTQKTAITLVAIAVCLFALGGWLAGIWLQVFFTELIDDPVSRSFGAILNFVVLLLFALLFLPVAWVVDKMKDGQYIVMMWGCALVFFLSLPLMYIIQLGNKLLFGVVVGHFLINFLVLVFSAPMTPWVVQKFPVAVRFSALAVAYNVSQMIFGASAPLLATFLVCTGSAILGGLLFPASAFISGAAVFIADKTNFGRRVFAESINEQEILSHEELLLNHPDHYEGDPNVYLELGANEKV